MLPDPEEYAAVGGKLAHDPRAWGGAARAGMSAWTSPAYGPPGSAGRGVLS